MIYNHSYQEKKNYPFITYHHFHFVFGKYICLELPGLCWFFHETWWFSEALELWWTDGSLNLSFFNYPNPTVVWFWKFSNAQNWRWLRDRNTMTKCFLFTHHLLLPSASPIIYITLDLLPSYTLFLSFFNHVHMNSRTPQITQMLLPNGTYLNPCIPTNHRWMLKAFSGPRVSFQNLSYPIMLMTHKVHVSFTCKKYVK